VDFASYLLGLDLALGLLSELALAASDFIGAPQQTTSHGSQSQAFSTTSTSPQSSQEYLSPFLFAKKTPLKLLYRTLG
jgi:hypothetical protein